MNNKRYIQLLQIANDRYMKDLESDHNDFISSMEKDPEVLKWYSKHQDIISLNLFELLDQKKEIEDLVRNELNGVSSRDRSIYRIVFTGLWLPIYSEIVRRIRNLNSTQFKIRAYENRDKHIPYPKLSAEEVRVSVKIEDLCKANNIEIKQNRAICPLHQDKDPSFRIYPNTNSFYCFGCNKGGDVITLAMELYFCSFTKALEILSGISS